MSRGTAPSLGECTWDTATDQWCRDLGSLCGHTPHVAPPDRGRLFGRAPVTTGTSTSYAAAVTYDIHGGVRAETDEQQGSTTDDVEVPGPRSPSAARLLEMTARETDRWRADARAEADGIVAAAKEEADALVRAAQREVDGILDEARQTAARTVADARANADSLHAESAQQRAEAESEVARLRQVADEHSDVLRRHLHEVLERLDSGLGRPAREDA
ncbi:hypothetical protein NOZE110980_18270 [Nocardioides zeicaulis]